MVIFEDMISMVCKNWSDDDSSDGFLDFKLNPNINNKKCLLDRNIQKECTYAESKFQFNVISSSIIIEEKNSPYEKGKRKLASDFLELPLKTIKEHNEQTSDIHPFYSKKSSLQITPCTTVIPKWEDPAVTLPPPICLTSNTKIIPSHIDSKQRFKRKTIDIPVKIFHSVERIISDVETSSSDCEELSPKKRISDNRTIKRFKKKTIDIPVKIFHSVERILSDVETSSSDFEELSPKKSISDNRTIDTLDNCLKPTEMNNNSSSDSLFCKYELGRQSMCTDNSSCFPSAGLLSQQSSSRQISKKETLPTNALKNRIGSVTKNKNMKSVLKLPSSNLVSQCKSPSIVNCKSWNKMIKKVPSAVIQSSTDLALEKKHVSASTLPNLHSQFSKLLDASQSSEGPNICKPKFDVLSTNSSNSSKALPLEPVTGGNTPKATDQKQLYKSTPLKFKTHSSSLLILPSLSSSIKHIDSSQSSEYVKHKSIRIKEISENPNKCKPKFNMLNTNSLNYCKSISSTFVSQDDIIKPKEMTPKEACQSSSLNSIYSLENKKHVRLFPTLPCLFSQFIKYNHSSELRKPKEIIIKEEPSENPNKCKSNFNALNTNSSNSFEDEHSNFERQFISINPLMKYNNQKEIKSEDKNEELSQYCEDTNINYDLEQTECETNPFDDEDLAILLKCPKQVRNEKARDENNMNNRDGKDSEIDDRNEDIEIDNKNKNDVINFHHRSLSSTYEVNEINKTPCDVDTLTKSSGTNSFPTTAYIKNKLNHLKELLEISSPSLVTKTGKKEANEHSFVTITSETKNKLNNLKSLSGEINSESHYKFEKINEDIKFKSTKVKNTILISPLPDVHRRKKFHYKNPLSLASHVDTSVGNHYLKKKRNKHEKVKRKQKRKVKIKERKMKPGKYIDRKKCRVGYLFKNFYGAINSKPASHLVKSKCTKDSNALITYNQIPSDNKRKSLTSLTGGKSESSCVKWKIAQLLDKQVKPKIQNGRFQSRQAILTETMLDVKLRENSCSNVQPKNQEILLPSRHTTILPSSKYATEIKAVCEKRFPNEFKELNIYNIKESVVSPNVKKTPPETKDCMPTRTNLTKSNLVVSILKDYGQYYPPLKKTVRFNDYISYH